MKHADGTNVTPEQVDAINEWLEGRQIIGYALDECKITKSMKLVEWGGCDTAKWYDSDDDMTELSKSFPDCLFRLYGEGEDRDDTWENYYWNGKSEQCRMICTWEQPKEIPW